MQHQQQVQQQQIQQQHYPYNPNPHQPSYPGYLPQQAQHFPPQPTSQPQVASQFQHNPSGMMTADLAQLAQQGYAQQQAQLQAMQAAQAGQIQAQQAHMHGGAGPSRHMMPAGYTGSPHAAAGQMGKSQSRKRVERRPNDAMAKYAGQAPPDAHARALRQDTTAPEPWTDAIDEIDARELAMKRFRTRQELLSDIFGPEQLKSIRVEEVDPWVGFGMDGETLEAKVAALEKETAELEKQEREMSGAPISA